jgi:hypothetical protein
MGSLELEHEGLKFSVAKELVGPERTQDWHRREEKALRK